MNRFSHYLLHLIATAHLSGEPAIRSLSPAAVSQGTATTITIHGDRLSGLSDVWTSFPSSFEVLSSDDNSQQEVRIDLESDVPVGIGALRIATPNGTSNLHLLMIDDLPSVTETKKRRSNSTGQFLEIPVAIDGVCDEAYSDSYQIRLREGQLISVEAVAQRLGYLLDPRIRISDLAEREQVIVEDTRGLSGDARIRFWAPDAGVYSIEIRDARYEIGWQHGYRLRIGDYPLVTLPFPLGAQAGKTVRFFALGKEGHRVNPLDRFVPKGKEVVPLSFAFDDGYGSGFTRAVVSQLDEVIESEPNGRTATATPISIPAAINGLFEKPNDRDWFEWSANEGDRLEFTGVTRSLGSPSALYLRLETENGEWLGEADVTTANEATLKGSFKKTGRYRLLVEELTRAGGPGHGYRIEVKHHRSGFTLSVNQDKVSVAPGAAFELKVSAARDGYDGPIKLSLANLSDEFCLENSVIAEKEPGVTLKVNAPKELAIGSIVHFSVTGSAKDETATIRTTASTRPALTKLFPKTPFPPQELDGLIALSVQPRSEAKARVTE